MATRKYTKTVRLMHLVEEIPSEIQKLLPTNLKEIQNYEHPLLLKTLQQMRDTENTFFELDTIFPCVLAFLLLDQLNRKHDKELQDELQETLASVLKKEPDNLIALCIKQKMKKTRATKEKIETLVTQPINLNQAFATIALYLYQLKLTKASIKLFEKVAGVQEQNEEVNYVKVVIWKLILAEAHHKLLSREVFSNDISPDTTMIRVNKLLQPGIELKENQDGPLRYVAARCYVVLALTYCKYEYIQKQNSRQKDLCMAVDAEQCYNEAWTLCDGQDPYVVEQYGLFLKETATNAESLKKAVDILEPLLRICPYRHVAAYQLALTHEALWVIEKQKHDNLNDETSLRLGVEKQQEPKSGSNHQESRSQNVGDGSTEYEQINKTSSETWEGAVGGRDISSSETLEGAVGGRDISSSEILEGAVGGRDISSSETLEGAVGGRDISSSEILEGAVGGRDISNSEALEGAVGGRDISSSETLEGAVGGRDISNSETLEGAVGGRDISCSGTLEGAVGGRDISSSETLEGAVGGRDISNSETLEGAVGGRDISCSGTLEGAVGGRDISCSETLEGAVGGRDISNSETLEGAVGGRDISISETLEGAVGGRDISCSETLEGAVGGDNIEISETLKGILRGKGPPNIDIWHNIKGPGEETISQHRIDTLIRSAEILTKPQTTRKPLSCHLALARQYLIMANESANSQCVVYLVDLARMHAACGETDSALRCFENAKYVLSSHHSVTNHWDMAYLYEQWALMLVKQLESRKEYENLRSNLEIVQKELDYKLKVVYIYKYFENRVKQEKVKIERHIPKIATMQDELTRIKGVQCAANALIEVAKDKLKSHKTVTRQLENQIEKEQRRFQQQHGITLKVSGTLLDDLTQRLNAMQKHHEDFVTLIKSEESKQEDSHKEAEILQRKIQQIQSTVEIAMTAQKELQRQIEKYIKQLEYRVEVRNPSLSKEDIKENLEDILQQRVEKAVGEVDHVITTIEDILTQLEDVDDVTASDVSDGDDFEDQAQQLNRIECYFLKSIHTAVKIKYNSKTAFNKLAEMLENDLQNDTSSQKWFMLCEIYQLAGQYEKAKHILEDKDMTTSKARKLFKQQCIQRQEFGKYLDLAFSVYLNTPDDLLRHDIVEMTIHKMKQEAAVVSDDTEPFKAYGEALKVFLKPVVNKASKAQNNCTSDGSIDTNFLVFMARPENTETGGFKYIVENLPRCGVQIQRYLKRSIDDFEFGCNTRAEILRMLEVCQLILVSDFKDSCPMADSLPPVGFIIEAVEEYGCNVPVLILHEADDPPIREWSKFHHLDIREMDNDAKFHEFMTELFQNICPPKCSICKNTVRKITFTP